MKKNNYYIQNYYTLKNSYEINNFMDKVDKDNLRILIQPTIKNIIDKIFIFITTHQTITNFNQILIDTDKADSKLLEILSTDKEFNLIEENDLKSCLITKSFIKFFQRIFLKDGLNDEKYDIQSYLQKWLEILLAESIVNDVRFKPYKITKSLIEVTEILHTFYTTFIELIPQSWIQDQYENWISVDDKPDKMLFLDRPFNDNFFSAYKSKYDKIDSVSWYEVMDLTRYSEEQIFNLKYRFNNSVLMEKNSSLWIKFIDNLKFPILQDIAMNRTADDEIIFLNAAQEIENQKLELKTSPKILAYLILKNFFKYSIEVQNNLNFYIQEEQTKYLTSSVDRKLIKKGQIELSNWLKKRDSIYLKIIIKLSNILSLSEVSEWIFSYKSNPVRNKYFDNTHNNEILILTETFKKYTSNITFDAQHENLKENFNLQKFNYLADIMKSEVDAQNLVMLLISLIKKEDFYFDSNNNEYTKIALRLTLVLSRISNPISEFLNLIDIFKINYEGWKINDTNRNYYKEDFIYCACIFLLTENSKIFADKNKENEYFDIILNHLILQLRFSSSKILTYRYHLAILFKYVCNNNLERKFVLERKYITGIDSLQTLLEIFGSFEDCILEDKSKKLLEEKFKSEFDIIKKRYIQNNRVHEITLMQYTYDKLVQK